MVDSQGDIPDEWEVRPPNTSRRDALSDIFDTEVIVSLRNGETVELHPHDTHVFTNGMVYTKQDDDDVWFFTEEIVTIKRHYE